ncbi:pentapeptide repeat-containing protein [Glycomyces harbinensis]|uniref:Pentapeptide repeat-containing protein n=1 Tax=Glycomyces harbinensis TaxID=58114 RepID=A0A1G6VL63_9ACTN|nr:pentapeptide repeat-containing protein [Glycomyces harbinensis]SDD54319.1 hypothetical protein SAMN05216270_1056 [Glycomyces harbinensis]
MKEEQGAAWPRWRRWIGAGAGFVAACGVLVFAVLLPPAWGDPLARTEAIKTAWTVTGGIATLVGSTLFIFKLRLDREVHDHQVEKDVFDQLDKAIAQLDGDTSASQTTGLRALDRLGTAHPELREQVAETWCNFLRSPLADPDGHHDARALAQRLLLDHLRVPYESGPPSAHVRVPEDADHYWDLRRLDLRTAVLIDADFTDCLLPAFDAQAAVFHGHTRFTRARFLGSATFARADVKGPLDCSDTFFAAECNLDRLTAAGAADFTRANFRGPLECQSADFSDAASFTSALFEAPVRFWQSRFAGTADFSGATWIFEAGFTLAVFEGFAGFAKTRFLRRAVFGRATFGGQASFESVQFGHRATFTGVTFCDAALFADGYFDQDVAFDDAAFGSIARFREAQFHGQVTCCGARFEALLSFQGAQFKDRADFSMTVLTGDAVVDCTDATATVGEFAPSDRIWPRGWTALRHRSELRLVPIPDMSIEFQIPPN